MRESCQVHKPGVGHLRVGKCKADNLGELCHQCQIVVDKPDSLSTFRPDADMRSAVVSELNFRTKLTKGIRGRLIRRIRKLLRRACWNRLNVRLLVGAAGAQYQQQNECGRAHL